MTDFFKPWEDYDYETSHTSWTVDHKMGTCNL